jgi:hypothetical protein
MESLKHCEGELTGCADDYYLDSSTVNPSLDMMPTRSIREDGLFYIDLVDEDVIDLRAAWVKKAANEKLSYSGMPEDFRKLVDGKIDKTEIEVRHYCRLAATKWDSPTTKVKALAAVLKENVQLLDKLNHTITEIKSQCATVSKQVELILKELEEPGQLPSATA